MPPFLTSRFASTKYAVLDCLSASMNTRSNGSGFGWSVRSESIAGPRMTETLLARPAAAISLLLPSRWGEPRTVGNVGRDAHLSMFLRDF
jgi:hypothetical protein